MDRYNFKTVEDKWQKYWIKNNTFKSIKTIKTILLFRNVPYPSGKIHMGHVRNYTIGDVLARYKHLWDTMSCILGWILLECTENYSKQNNLSPKIGLKKIFLCEDQLKN